MPTSISILIIEDNLGDQLLLHENLKATRLTISEISVVATLAGALTILKEKSYSLIFLDLFLPDSSGLETFTELVAVNSKVAVIIYSGLDDEKVSLKAISLGAQDFLIKGDYSDKLLEKTVKYSIERQRNLDALEISNARYDLVSKATHDMVWDWDLATNEVYRNAEGWKKIFRSVEVHSAGVKQDWLTKVHANDRQKIMKIINNVIASESQKFFEVEFRVLRDDNSIGWVEDRGYIIRNDDGKAIRLIGASHDITERKIAEEKVLLSEQRFKSLVQNSLDLLGILNADGNYIYVSPTSQKILGYDPEFLIGQSTFAFVHEDDIQTVKECFAAMSTQKFIEVPLFRFKHSLGEWRWIERTLTNLMDDPAVGGIVSNSRDVTEKKIADDEIEKLSLVAKNTLSGVFIIGADNKIQWVNNAFTKITEYTLEDAIGKTPAELLYGKNPDQEIVLHIREQISKGLSFEGERLNYTKSGKPVWLWVQLQPLFNDKGEIKQYFGVQTDITEKKNAKDEVEKLSMIARETINGVIITDENEKIVWVNDAFIKLSGYGLAEVIGRRPLDFLSGAEPDQSLQLFLEEQKLKKIPYVFETLNYSKSGNKFFVKVQVQPIFNESGEIIQYFSLQTDITHDKFLEEKVELEKIIKHKEITEAVITAHENERSEIGRELHDNVNQLLAASKLYNEMARTEVKNRDSLLLTSADYTMTAIEEIRKLSKTLITPLIKEIGLVQSIQDLAEGIMLVHPLNIKLSVKDFDEHTLNEKFKLNIYRIVQEQINNTLKHAQAKTITIDVSQVNNKISITLTDDGVGFDTSQKSKGVGLSNIISRAELYKGEVKIESSAGKGCLLLISFIKSDLLLA